MLKEIAWRSLAVVLLAAVLAAPLQAWETERAGEELGLFAAFLELVADAWAGIVGEEPAAAVYEAEDGGGATTQSGGCIDPWGRPRPCA